MGAASSSQLVIIGAKLGLCRALAGAGPLTSTEMDDRAGGAERYERDWPRRQAVGGDVE